MGVQLRHYIVVFCTKEKPFRDATNLLQQGYRTHRPDALVTGFMSTPAEQSGMNEDETVLVLKVRGVPSDIEQRLHEENLSQELFDGIDALCDELDIEHRGLGQSVTEEPAVEPPTHDTDPVEPIEGWTGGEVEHTGGGIFCRIFRNPDRHLEVVYDADRPAEGVSLYAQRWSEEFERWENIGNELDNRGDVETDADAVEACRELMEKANNGEYDDELDDLRK